MAHLTTNPADKERFLCIYPSYINSKKTLAEGRRIAAEKAVENPSCAEIRDVLVAAGLNVLVEVGDVGDVRLSLQTSRFCCSCDHVIMTSPVFLSQNKMYPREWNRDVQFRGRVRIQIKLEDGSLCQEKFSNRKDVMFYAAEMIPKLKSRTQKSGGAEAGSQPGEGGKKGKKKKK
ncbi:unnamed protein product [Leuciscus chuanchicus]